MAPVQCVAERAAAAGDNDMKRHEVELQLVAIAAEAHHDPEAATSRERRMLRDVLIQISARGDEDSRGLAGAALRAWELEFRRQ